MLFHPPILYLGYVGFTVPFAFAIAALVTGRVGEGWLMETRRWALFSWAFLTIGILLGGWWSYEVLGWSGVWAWDPVENASFLPWLTGTAYIHSVLVQERRGMLRVWNLSLLVATFSLTILGTFLTRSGVLSSVHAFGDGPVGDLPAGVLRPRRRRRRSALIGWRGDRLRSPGAIDSPLSREGAFLANNVLFTVFAFVVLLGTVFPLLVEALQDRRTVVGAPYFDRLSTPIGLALLFLMAVAPVLPWRKASVRAAARPAVLAGVVRRRRAGRRRRRRRERAGAAASRSGSPAAPPASALRQLVLATRRQGWRGLVGRANGGMIVHLGVIVIAVALVASNSYTRSADARARRSARRGRVGRAHVRAAGRPRDASTSGRGSSRPTCSLDGDRVYGPATTKYLRQGIDVGTPSVRTGADQRRLPDARARRRARATTEATIRVFVKPLILWLWIGGAVMAIGTLLAAFPGRRRRRPTDPVSAPVRVERPAAASSSTARSTRSTPRPSAASRRSSPSPSPSSSPGCSSCSPAPTRRPNETAETTADGPAGAGGRRRAGRRRAVRPRPPQGRLGGAQLLPVELRAVPAGAPRARARSPSSRRRCADGAELYTVVYDDDRDERRGVLRRRGRRLAGRLRRRRLDRRRLRRVQGARDVDHRPERRRARADHLPGHAPTSSAPAAAAAGACGEHAGR